MNHYQQLLDGLAIGPQWVRRHGSPVSANIEVTYATGLTPPATVPQPATLPDTMPVHDQTVTGEVPPDGAAPQAVSAAVSPQGSSQADAHIASMDWDELQHCVATCTRCSLSATRTKTVFGVGDRKASWLFVGEGPGASEDQRGEPFVGPAGQLLDNMLAAMALHRKASVFITNAVKCRPFDESGKDRPPTQQEVQACRPYLTRQIALIAPKKIVALGKTAAITLLERPPATAVAALRGVVHQYGTVPLVVTYHPSYLLRVPADKRKSWQDLCLAMNTHDTEE